MLWNFSLVDLHEFEMNFPNGLNNPIRNLFEKIENERFLRIMLIQVLWRSMLKDESECSMFWRRISVFACVKCVVIRIERRNKQLKSHFYGQFFFYFTFASTRIKLNIHSDDADVNVCFRWMKNGFVGHKIREPWLTRHDLWLEVE